MKTVNNFHNLSKAFSVFYNMEKVYEFVEKCSVEPISQYVPQIFYSME